MAHQNDLPATQGQHGWSREKGYFATEEAKAKEVVAEAKDGGLEEVIDRHIEGEQAATQAATDTLGGPVSIDENDSAHDSPPDCPPDNFPPTVSTMEEKSSDPSAADLDAQAADDQAATDTQSATQQ